MKRIQQALIDVQAITGNAYDLGSSGPNHDGVDGIYGGKTENAVKKFKGDEGLGSAEFGDVGPGTMRCLDELFTSAPPPPGPPNPEPVKAAESSTVVTDKPGKQKPGQPPEQPDIKVHPHSQQDVVPNNSAGKKMPAPPVRLFQIEGKVEANLRLFSKGDDPASAVYDPCRWVEVNSSVSGKLNIDGYGIGKDVFLFYHQPDLTLTPPHFPCSHMPEIQVQIGLVHVVASRALELALRPGFILGEGQLKPGIWTGAEINPFWKENNLLGVITIHP